MSIVPHELQKFRIPIDEKRYISIPLKWLLDKAKIKRTTTLKHAIELAITKADGNATVDLQIEILHIINGVKNKIGKNTRQELMAMVLFMGMGWHLRKRKAVGYEKLYNVNGYFTSLNLHGQHRSTIISIFISIAQVRYTNVSYKEITREARRKLFFVTNVIKPLAEAEIAIISLALMYMLAFPASISTLTITVFEVSIAHSIVGTLAGLIGLGAHLYQSNLDGKISPTESLIIEMQLLGFVPLPIIQYALLGVGTVASIITAFTNVVAALISLENLAKIKSAAEESDAKIQTGPSTRTPFESILLKAHPELLQQAGSKNRTNNDRIWQKKNLDLLLNLEEKGKIFALESLDKDKNRTFNGHSSKNPFSVENHQKMPRNITYITKKTSQYLKKFANHTGYEIVFIDFQKQVPEVPSLSLPGLDPVETKIRYPDWIEHRMPLDKEQLKFRLDNKKTIKPNFKLYLDNLKKEGKHQVVNVIESTTIDTNKNNISGKKIVAHSAKTKSVLLFSIDQFFNEMRCIPNEHGTAFKLKAKDYFHTDPIVKIFSSSKNAQLVFENTVHISASWEGIWHAGTDDMYEYKITKDHVPEKKFNKNTYDELARQAKSSRLSIENLMRRFTIKGKIIRIK